MPRSIRVANPIVIGNSVKQQIIRSNDVGNCDIKATGLVNEAPLHLAGVKMVGANLSKKNGPYLNRAVNCALRVPRINRKQKTTLIEMGAETFGGITPEVCLTNGSVLVPPEKTPKPRRPRNRKSRHKKRFEAQLPCAKASVLPQEEEDWEKEIQEVSPVDWARAYFRLMPYGPEDVQSFDLQEMTLCHKLKLELQISANFNPAKHHPSPVKWVCNNQTPEADQFVDAED